MSYKYDRVNGYRNADQITADLDEFNPEVVDVTSAIKKVDSKDVRTAINIVAEKEKRKEKEAIYYSDKNGNLIRDDEPTVSTEDLAKDARKEIEEMDL